MVKVGIDLHQAMEWNWSFVVKFSKFVHNACTCAQVNHSSKAMYGAGETKYG